MTTLVRRTAFGVLTVERFPSSLSAASLLSRIHPEEAALARAWGERRQRTYAMGRLVARSALVALGGDVAGPILHDDRGAPRLAAPLSLSLSHKDEVAAALVEHHDGSRIGVDVEPLTPHEHARDIASHVLTEREREQLAHLDETVRHREVLVRFALKEALYKALDPYVRRYVGFLEVEARPRGLEVDDERDVELTLALVRDGNFAASGRVLRIGELVVALARVTRA